MTENNAMNDQLIGLLQQVEFNLRTIEAIMKEAQEKRKEKSEVYHSHIASQVIIAANDIWESEPVNNGKFNRGRIFLDALFTPAHSNGLSVELYFGGNRLGEVVRIRATSGSGGKASEPIDIANLSGFKFVIRNHDSSNATTIRNFKIVMYNEFQTFNNELI